MCPTPIGRIQTRVATLVAGAILGLALSLLSGRPDWIVLIGVFLLMGVVLDAGVYSWALRYQPPWMTGVIGLVELGLLFALATALGLDLAPLEAVLFYVAVWSLASLTRIVVLPIISLTYLESAGEFRRAEWSVPPAQASVPLLASASESGVSGGLVRRASGAHRRPLQSVPPPSGVAHTPPAGAHASKEARR